MPRGEIAKIVHEIRGASICCGTFEFG